MTTPIQKPSKLEAILWSIALPGFGQILNGKLIKGLVFIGLEFLINIKSHFNSAILESFRGHIDLASHVINYEWLMFYPCVYMFTMWDAYRDAKGAITFKTYLPFVFGAYFVTVGLTYATQIKVFGAYLGPVFLPILFLLPGLLIGAVVRNFFKEKGSGSEEGSYD